VSFLKPSRTGCDWCVIVIVSEQQERAFTLGLAGLLGEGVFNFGELVSWPGANSLMGQGKGEMTFTT
jgi:hypothetical protein